MSTHLMTGVSLEDSQDPADFQGIDHSAQDAHKLFPELDIMAPENLQLRSDKDDLNELLNYEQISNEGVSNQAGDRTETQEPSDFATTDFLVPPISHSNPETPNEPIDFSFGDDIPLMHRVLSEQSVLPSLSARYQNVQPQVRFWNQRYGQDERDERSQEAGPNALSHHQAGLELEIPFEGTHQSNIGTPMGLSNLSNTYTSTSLNLAQSPSGGNLKHQPQIRTGIEYPALEYLKEPRGRRHTDAELCSQQYQMAEGNIYNPVNFAAHGISTSTGPFPDPLSYHSPRPQYSQANESHSPYIPSHIHGNLAHGNFNSDYYRNELMLEQPTYSFPGYTIPDQATYFQQNSNTMKQDKPNPDQDAQSVNYRSLQNDETSADAQTQRPNQNAGIPRNSEEDKPYFDTLMASMFDVSQAEDNEGMILTWRNQLNDRDAIAEVARNILRLCKRREELGHPFRKGGKPAHQFDNFRDRFDALCQALRTQKTMCKHLMRQPYIEEIIDDPQGAVGRIANNRKVNKGKKAAIEEGRIAMNRKALGKPQVAARAPIQVAARTPIQVDDDGLDAEHDSDHEGFSHPYAVRRPNAGHVAPRSREKASRARRTSSEDTYDHEESAPKRAKRASRSKYQLNENNEMVDTSVTPLKEKPHSRPARFGAMGNSQFQNPYGGMASVGDHHPTDPMWTSDTNVEHGGVLPTSAYAPNYQYQHPDLRQRRHSRR